MAAGGSVTSVHTSEKGWVRVSCDFRRWIPCPVQFPVGFDHGNWPAAMAREWWDKSGGAEVPGAVDKLASMLRSIYDHRYATGRCQQIWVYLPNPWTPPLAVHIGIWQMTGERASQLRLLSGADDPDMAGAPRVADFSTSALGTGVRTLRHKEMTDGTLYGILAYAFRSAEFETDLQVWATSRDLRELHRADGDIAEFIRGVSVFGTAGA